MSHLPRSYGGDEDAADVCMGGGMDPADEEVDSGEENDEEDPAQLEATRLRGKEILNCPDP